MEIDKWIGEYKVRAFDWIDKKRIYINVQYFKGGQSIQAPPVWDKSVFVLKNKEGVLLVHKFTQSLVEFIKEMEIIDNTEITITVGKL